MRLIFPPRRRRQASARFAGLIANLYVVLKDHQLVTKVVVDLVNELHVLGLFRSASQSGFHIQQFLVQMVNGSINLPARTPRLLGGSPQEILHVWAEGLDDGRWRL